MTSLRNYSIGQKLWGALRRELSRGERDRKPVAILLADIDHFKQINDSLGHAAADIVLQEVARRLQSDSRPYELVGGYGGEEFLLVLPDVLRLWLPAGQTKSASWSGKTQLRQHSQKCESR